MLPIHSTRSRCRRHLVPLILIAVVVVVLGSQGTGEAKMWESREHNCVLITPDEPYPWEWLPANPQWKKYGIVRGARRVLEKRKDGKPVSGEGAILHLAIQDAPAESTLQQLAASDPVRAFFLKRFGGSEESVESEEWNVNSGSNKDGHPSVILRAEGQSANLRGNKQKCTGVMVITLCRGKLYMLRMYAFPTEFGQDGLEIDLDMMEGGDYGLELIDSKEEEKTEAPKPPPDADDGGAEEEEEREDELLEFRPQKWRITIDKKLTRLEITETERDEDLILKLAGSDRMGSYAVYLYAPKLGRIVNGQQLPAPDLVKWMTATWWKNFNPNHPEGEVSTFKWPKKTSRPTFLTFPDLGDPKAKRVVFKPKQKRPIEVDAGDMIKKMKCVEKPKKKNIGKKGKGVEAIRGILRGNRPRVGVETVARYAWRSSTHSYRLFVTMTNDAYKKWGEPVRKTLESIEFGIKFKD